jgi:hypothetical protein
MPAPTMATLAYTATVPDIIPTATAQAKMAAVPLYASPVADPVLKDLFDCTVTSDVTAQPAANKMRRTIQLALGAGFFSLFPNQAIGSFAQSPFADLFGRTLALALPADVVSEPVVFT